MLYFCLSTTYKSDLTSQLINSTNLMLGCFLSLKLGMIEFSDRSEIFTLTVIGFPSHSAHLKDFPLHQSSSSLDLPIQMKEESFLEIESWSLILYMKSLNVLSTLKSSLSIVTTSLLFFIEEEA